MTWAQAIYRYIKRLRRMRRWAIEHNDPEMYRDMTRFLREWKQYLREELRWHTR